MPEVLRFDAQGAIEFARAVFPGDEGSEFDNFILGEITLDLGEQRVVHVLIRIGNSVRVFESNAFLLVEEGARLVVGKG